MHVMGPKIITNVIGLNTINITVAIIPAVARQMPTKKIISLNVK